MSRPSFRVRRPKCWRRWATWSTCSTLDRRSFCARRDEVLEIADRFGISEVRVFGSVARGDDGPDSDIDLMVSFEPDSMNVSDLVAFEDERTALLGVPVENETINIPVEPGRHTVIVGARRRRSMIGK